MIKKTKKLIIFGLGDIARLAKYYFDIDSNYQVVSFTADKKYINSNTFLNLPVTDFEKIEKLYPASKFEMFIAISYAKMNKVRAEKYNITLKKGYKHANYISSKASLFSNVKIGNNCFILENNTVQPFVQIGNNVTLWSGNHIGHDSVIGDHSFISSHVVVSGHVNVGKYCFIGVNATIRDSINIADNSLIGAGSVIMKSTLKNQVYVPGRSILLNKKSNQIKL